MTLMSRHVNRCNSSAKMGWMSIDGMGTCARTHFVITFKANVSSRASIFNATDGQHTVRGDNLIKQCGKDFHVFAIPQLQGYRTP